MNPLGIELNGCPLDEKISEMHTLRKDGDALGALAIVTIDNPMCPGTGHRICNDCMKSCIYQKQEPVNIPQIETGVLTDVLRLPWGVEIYGLLTRWNPLNVRRPYALPYNGKNILVVGLGPAGYTLAHYLVNEGFGVVGIDGLKIEPLPGGWSAPTRRRRGRSATGATIYRELDERVLEGFGGVSEYGITVRWDKNFLTLLHLTLARRRGLRMYGGIRFGGTMPIEDAWGYGFDHVAIATGAGRPTDDRHEEQPDSRHPEGQRLPDGAAADRRVQARSAAQPAGAAAGGGDWRRSHRHRHGDRADGVLPAAGGEERCGSTRALRRQLGESGVRAHVRRRRARAARRVLRVTARAVRAERARAPRRRSAARFRAAGARWGGVTLAYRKRMVDSPAYRLNHEEVIKALEEGIAFAENLNPIEAIPDERGAVSRDGLQARRTQGRWPGQPGSGADGPWSWIDAAGAHRARRRRHVAEHHLREGSCRIRFSSTPRRSSFSRTRRAERRRPVPPRRRMPDGFFTSYANDGRFVSYYGDNHPRYAGNVVKAMASAKDGYPKIVELFAAELKTLDPARQAERDAAWQALVAIDWTTS